MSFSEYDDSGDSFSFLEISAQKLEELELPQDSYPVPFSDLERALKTEAEITVEMLCYWMMRYISHPRARSEEYESHLLEIAERHAAFYSESSFLISGSNDELAWRLMLGNCSLEENTVTYEGQGRVKAAFNDHEDGFLMSCFTAPSLDLLLGCRLNGQFPRPDAHAYFGLIAFKVWAASNSTMWRSNDPLENRYVDWEFGVGWNTQEAFDENYRLAVGLNPLPSSWVAFFFRVFEIAERQLSHMK